MLVFLDETFRTHKRTGVPFGALMGVGIPEDAYSAFQRDWFGLCKPYFGSVLKEEHPVHGKDLLTATTLRLMAERGYTAHWSLAEDILNDACRRGFRVFGVVCFRSEFQSFVCADESKLDLTFRYLFERIDRYMRQQFPGRFAKMVFDDRGFATNVKNGRAANNFFLRSPVGMSYDTIIKTMLHGVSKNNVGLQLADLVSTVVGMKFQGTTGIDPLWQRVHRMLYKARVGEISQSSLKVIREKEK